jgi:hypothetical protein
MAEKIKDLPAAKFRDDFSKSIEALEKNLSKSYHSESYWNVMREKTEKTFDAIKSNDLIDLWEKSKNYRSTITESPINRLMEYEAGDDWLALAIFCCYPAFQKVSTISDSKIWKKTLVDKARGIIELIDDTPDDYIYIKDIFTAYIFKQLITDEHIGAFGTVRQLKLDSIVHIISLFSNLVSNAEPDTRFWTERKTSGKEKASNPKRAYFVRALTKGFIHRTGTPKRENVRRIANQLFTGNISQKQIIDLTKDIVENPENFPNPVEFALTNIYDSVTDTRYT